MTCRGVSIRSFSFDPSPLRPPPAKPAVTANGVGYPRCSPGRIAQRESARFTRGRSLVRSQVRPSLYKRLSAALSAPERARWKRLWKRLARIWRAVGRPSENLRGKKSSLDGWNGKDAFHEYRGRCVISHVLGCHSGAKNSRVSSEFFEAGIVVSLSAIVPVSQLHELFPLGYFLPY